MNTFVLESEDLDFLMTEECQMFMYEAAPQVKESFFKRAIAKIKAMLQKVSDFITSATTKKQAEAVKKAVDKNPQLANKKIKIEDYQSSYKLGKSALKKLEKAKTKEEADKIVAQYKRNRVIKTVTISVAALATLVAGGKLFMRARTQMKDVGDELSKLSAEIQTTQAEINNAKARFRGGSMMDAFDDDEPDFGKLEKKLQHAKTKYNAQAKVRILGIMAQDLKTQTMKPFQALKGAMSRKQTPAE